MVRALPTRMRTAEKPVGHGGVVRIPRIFANSFHRNLSNLLWNLLWNLPWILLSNETGKGGPRLIKRKIWALFRDRRIFPIFWGVSRLMQRKFYACCVKNAQFSQGVRARRVPSPQHLDMFSRKPPIFAGGASSSESLRNLPPALCFQKIFFGGQTNCSCFFPPNGGV